MVLLWGPTGGLFLMSEVSLHYINKCCWISLVVRQTTQRGNSLMRTPPPVGPCSNPVLRDL